MNISLRELAGPLFQPMGRLKSTEEKLQRRENMENQVAALKDRQAGLKNRECDTLESIAEKLELYHSYESEIAAVKKAYNMAEMSHMMDEAEERGEQIAKAADKLEPKTEEERRKEALEEATGTEQGLLAKLLDESMLTDEELEDTCEQMLSDTYTKLRDEYQKENRDISFEDLAALIEKAYQEVSDEIDRWDGETDQVERVRKQCRQALEKAYERMRKDLTKMEPKTE